MNYDFKTWQARPLFPSWGGWIYMVKNMTPDQPTKAQCPKCRNDMLYVTAVPHRSAPQMQRTTFVCYACNQTRSYMLSAAMADAYAIGSPALLET